MTDTYIYLKENSCYKRRSIRNYVIGNEEKHIDLGFEIINLDPNITTTEEGLTPLHFAARYTPRIIDKDIQLQESTAHESEGTVTVGKLSTSVATMIYLIQLKGEKSVKVNIYMHTQYIHNNNVEYTSAVLAGCCSLYI